MNEPFAIPDETIEPELDPLELDPRPCGECGCTIDHHRRVDTPEGPEFFCWDDDDIVKQWQLADPRDAWKHTGERPPPKHVRNSNISATPAKAPQYRTPQSVVDAFFFVARTKDAAGIAEWLANHPRDEKYLQKIWEQKCSISAAK